MTRAPVHCASIPLRVPRDPPPFLRANQKCNGSHDRTACADPAARRAPWPPTHGPCVSDFFLIRTEEGRRTTGNTESRNFVDPLMNFGTPRLEVRRVVLNL